MKAVVFDMDGLMFDTERVFMLAWDHVGVEMGLGKAGYMGLKTLGSNVEKTQQMWREEFGDKYDEGTMRRLTKEFLTKYYSENKVPVKKGLYILLDYLKSEGYKLAVASSSSKQEVVDHMKDAGVFDYFDVIVCGDMIAESKPEPDIYLKACELLQVSSEESYALEDSRNGLLSAYRAGCKPIMVPDLWQPDEEIESILFGKCNDLEEVKEFLESLD